MKKLITPTTNVPTPLVQDTTKEDKPIATPVPSLDAIEPATGFEKSVIQTGTPSGVIADPLPKPLTVVEGNKEADA